MYSFELNELNKTVLSLLKRAVISLEISYKERYPAVEQATHYQFEH